MAASARAATEQLAASARAEREQLRFIDIGANMNDPQFQGVYHGSQKHAPDIASVFQRAWDHGLEKIIITGTTLEESAEGLAMAREDPRLFVTVGCHPTRAGEFLSHGAAKYRAGLKDLILANRDKVVAVGETGLDWDRLHFCAKDVQLAYFVEQLLLADEVKLPLFLHMRSCEDDFVRILREHKARLHGGVVHSYTGSLATAQLLISEFDLFIGINGCSLKTEENLAVVRALPVDRLMLETDCPWCDIRPSHAGHKFVDTAAGPVARKKYEDGFPLRGRNEPCYMRAVLDVVAGIKGADPAALAAQIFENTTRMFCFPDAAAAGGGDKKAL